MSGRNGHYDRKRWEIAQALDVAREAERVARERGDMGRAGRFQEIVKMLEKRAGKG
jgi:anionic cell wall polymer biosynthesis LytR-Cps2A-Psr (LCP) family protein